MMPSESSSAERAAAQTVKSPETVSDAVAKKGYETVDPADFDRALKLSQTQHDHRYETSELHGGATIAESAESMSTATETAEKSKSLTQESQTATPHPENSVASRKPRESSNLEEEEDEQTLERQLFEFQEQEANERITAREWEVAILRIQDILQNPTIKEEETSWWIYREAHCLQMLGRWKDSLKLFDSGSFADGCGLSTYACGMQTVAEAQFQLDDYARAKTSCNAALKIWEKRKANDKSAKDFFNLCVEQMARITEALDKEVEARFYRSKCIEGYVFMAVLEQRKREEKERESQKMNPVEEVVLKRQELLAPFGLTYHVDDIDENSKQSSDGHTITSDRNDVADFELAFTAGLKEGNAELLDTMLLDNACVTKYWPLFLKAAIAEESDTYIEKLVYYGADVNTKLVTTIHDAPENPLSLAVEGGRTRAMKTLIELGANINGLAKNPDVFVEGRPMSGVITTPIHEAVKRGDMTALTYLINRGANIMIMNRKGLTPLHVAAFRGNRPVVSMLVKIGAKVNMQSYPEFETPLHLAVSGRHYQVVEFLLKHGANTELRNRQNKTPLEVLGYQQFQGYEKMKALLINSTVADSTSAPRKDKSENTRSFKGFWL